VSRQPDVGTHACASCFRRNIGIPAIPFDGAGNQNAIPDIAAGAIEINGGIARCNIGLSDRGGEPVGIALDDLALDVNDVTVATGRSNPGSAPLSQVQP
jgi:hypothetical protein